MTKPKTRMPTVNYLKAFLRNNVSPVITEHSLAEEHQQTAIFFCTVFDHVFERLDALETRIVELEENE